MPKKPDSTVDLDGDGPAPAEVVALDADELALSDRERLQQIFSARGEAADALRGAPLREHQLPPQLVREHVAAAVRTYILEAEALYRGTEPGVDYWQSADLGHFSPLEHVGIPPAPPWSDSPSRWEADGRITDAGDLPCYPDSTDAPTARYEGVKQFVDAPVPTPVTVEVDWERRTHGNGLPTVRDTDTRPTSDTISADVAPPIHVSEAAYRITNNLLADVGIGLEAEDRDKEVWGPDDAEETI